MNKLKATISTSNNNNDTTTTSSACIFKPTNASNINYHLDILTDGSELTGHGTVFFTISRGTRTTSSSNVYTTSNNLDTNNCTDTDIDTDTLLARYALTGLSTLTSRLASDQSFKLSPTRAVFTPFHPNHDIESTTTTIGLSSLLLALSNYSMTGTLHVVGPKGMETYVSSIVDLILGHRRVYPKVAICDIPMPTSTKNSAKRMRKNNDKEDQEHTDTTRTTHHDNDSTSTWWKVYDDEYIFVHARCIYLNTSNHNHNNNLHSNTHDDQNKTYNNNNNQIHNAAVAIYIITTKHHMNNNNNINPFSFVVIPPQLNLSIITYHQLFHPLPEEVVKQSVSTQQNHNTCTTNTTTDYNNIFSFFLHINPKSENILHNNITKSKKLFLKIHPSLTKLTTKHFGTIPNHNQIDNGILIRASYQSTLLHSKLPFVFPIQPELINVQRSEDRIQHGADDDDDDDGKVYSNCYTKSKNSDEYNTCCNNSTSIISNVPLIKLSSCSSMKLIQTNHDQHCNDDNDTIKECTNNLKYTILCRRIGIINKMHNGSMKHTFLLQDNNDDIKNSQNSNLNELIHVINQWRGESTTSSNIENGKWKENVDHNEIHISDDEEDSEADDENEIDISCEEEDDHDDEHKHSDRMMITKNIMEDKQASYTIMEKPAILILGTGCASPSPLRGSSGYALLLPTMIQEQVEKGKGGKWIRTTSLSAILECGEGTLLMLNRHLPRYNMDRKQNGMNSISHLSQIRMIWISHAHLDHYSELPLLIHEITKARRGESICNCFEAKPKHYTTKEMNSNNDDSSRVNQSTLIPKCKSCGNCLPPLVIAPPKVLHYLDISTNCKNGLHEMNRYRLFFSVSNRDFNSSPFTTQLRDGLFGFELRCQREAYKPFVNLHSIPVEHCPNAFGLLLTLRIPDMRDNVPDSNDSFFNLCYSGDTRPSNNLVQACNYHMNQGNHINNIHQHNRMISLLLHEATFDDDDRGRSEAIKKRHSTVKEAIEISDQMNAKSCLLTHFSQRYPRLPPSYKQLSERQGLGSAFDGMLIPLYESILPRLLQAVGLEIGKLLLHSSDQEDNDNKIIDFVI